MSNVLREEAKERGRLRSLFFSETGKISIHHKADFDTFCKQQEIATLTAKLAAAELALVEAQAAFEGMRRLALELEDDLTAEGFGCACEPDSQCATCKWRAKMQPFTKYPRQMLAISIDTTALDAYVKRVCGEPVAEVRNGQTVWYNGWPAYGTKLCIAPTFTTTKGQSHGA